MGPMLFALLGAVGSVGSFFVDLFAKKKVSMVEGIGSNANQAIGTISAAAMNIADSRSSSWLARCWRPLTALTFLGMIISRWFGYQPPHMAPDEIALIYHFMALLLGGMAISRGVEKVAGTMSMGRVVKGLLDNHIQRVSDAEEEEKGD